MNSIIRPTFTLSEEQNNNLAQTIFDDFEENFKYAEITVENILHLVANHSTEDGYTMAKELENNFGCTIDTLIVEELDLIAIMVHTEEMKLNHAWIKDNNITPKFEADSKVWYASKYGNENEREFRQRNINNIDYKKGTYQIEIEKGNHNRSWVVNFENVENIKENQRS